MYTTLTGAGAYAGCSYCCIKGEYSTILNKMIYLDHRSFLPAIDKLRLNKKSFASPNDVPKSPTIKTMNYVDSVIGKLTAASSNNERKQIVRQSGCTGVYSLRKLPNHDRYLNTPVEPMHLIKNIAERVVKLLSGETDTVKVRMEEKQRNRFRSSWTTVITENGKEKIYVPPAPFSLQKNEIDIANARAMNIRAPNGVDWQACHLFGKGASKLKSNEWKHVLSSGILKFCIRGLLGENQRNTLNELCDVISLICAEEIDLSIIDSLEYRVHRILSLLERDFPVSIHVIMFHLLHHLPTYIRRFGPVYNFWMYPMERFNSWISRRVLNRRYPESTVMETYRLYELSFFLQISDQLPSGAVTDIDKFNEDDENDHQYNDSLTESESEMDKKEHAPTSKLDPVDMNKLITCYRQIYPDYDKLVSKYERDKVIHEQTSTGYFPPISQWTPTSGPAMTPTELQFCKDTTDVVTRRKVYKMRDKHYRWIKYSSMEGERINSVRVSSYVHHKVGLVNGIKSFGRIQFMFDHMFNGHLHTLACVCWYDGHTTERDSGLVQVSKTSSTLTIVPFSDLSRPLIHAIDENDKNKLWILNSPS